MEARLARPWRIAVTHDRPLKLSLCVFFSRIPTECGGASTRRLSSPSPSSGPMMLSVRPEVVYGSLVQAVDGLTALASGSASPSVGPMRSLMGLAGGRYPAEPSPLALFMSRGTLEPDTRPKSLKKFSWGTSDITPADRCRPYTENLSGRVSRP